MEVDKEDIFEWRGSVEVVWLRDILSYLSYMHVIS